MSIAKKNKPNSEMAKKYIKEKKLSEYDSIGTAFGMVFEDLQMLKEKAKDQDKKIEELEGSLIRARALM